MLQKPRRIVDRALLDTYHEKQCMLCIYPAVPAHVRTVKRGGPDLPWNVMAICQFHHNEQHAHGIITFAMNHTVIWNWLMDNGWYLLRPDQLWHDGLNF